MKHKNVNRSLAVSAALIVASVLLAFSQKPIKIDSVLTESDSIAKAAKALKEEAVEFQSRVSSLRPAIQANKTDVSDIKRWIRHIVNRKPKNNIVSITLPVPVPVESPPVADKVVIVKKYVAPSIKDTTKRVYWKPKHSDGILENWKPFKFLKPKNRK